MLLIRPRLRTLAVCLTAVFLLNLALAAGAGSICGMNMRPGDAMHASKAGQVHDASLPLEGSFPAEQQQTNLDTCCGCCRAMKDQTQPVVSAPGSRMDEATNPTNEPEKSTSDCDQRDSCTCSGLVMPMMAIPTATFSAPLSTSAL